MAQLFNHILCPVDFSEPSGAALKIAKHLALLMGSKLHVLHVVEPILVPADFAFGPVTPVVLEKQFIEQAENSLNAIAQDAGTNLQIMTSMRRGKPFSEIVLAAKELHADLIVIGTHGLTGISHMLMGSTAEKVVRKSPCAVLTVKADDPCAKAADCR